MNFATLGFLGFFLAVLAVVHTVRTDRTRQWLLCAASYAFYGMWDVRFLPLLAGATALSYVGGKVVVNRPRLLGVIVAALIAPLALFKYTHFALDALVSAAGLMGVGLAAPEFAIVLPVGISFFTFQAVTYVCDVAWGRTRTETSVRRFATYMAFFPHLVAGPIVRASDFLPQLRRDWSPPSRAVMAHAIARFAWGLFKKVVIADHLAASGVNPLFGRFPEMTGGAVLVAIFAFGLQIYADFSAYSDMAISSARMMGYRLRENFDAPYMATSLRDFWRRWHISLSTVIRDYLYIPLGGSRGAGPARAAANRMVAMVLCGLWHGAAWNFVLWGLVHGVFLMVEQALPKWPSGLLARLAGWAATQAFVMAAWCLFRVSSLGEIQLAADRILHGGLKPVDLSPLYLALVSADALLLYGEQAMRRILQSRRRMGGGAAAAPLWLPFGTSLVLALATILAMNPTIGATAFIYFQF